MKLIPFLVFLLSWNNLESPTEIKLNETDKHSQAANGDVTNYPYNLEESVDPATALALAKFAYDVFNRPSGAGDPFDGIVTMLSSINKKLNTLNQKADIILKELQQLRKDVEFKESYNKLKSAFSASESIFRDYKNLIENLGEEKGEQRFLNEYKDLIIDYKKDIWDARTIISQLDDPISTNYLCLAGQMDYELGKLIDWNMESLVAEQKRYLEYFRYQLGEDENSIQSQFNKTKKRIKELLDFRHYERKIINYKFRREHVNAPFVPDDYTDVYLIKVKSTPNKKLITDQENEIYNFLFEQGYTESSTVYDFKMKREYIEQQEYESNAVPENSCVSEKSIIKKFYNLDLTDYENQIVQKCENEPVFIQLKTELEEEYKKLIIYGTALGNIDHSLSLINDLINQ